jgi:hypothetical protein
MKLSDLTGGVARTLQEADLAYPCSSLADPPITVAEALAVGVLPLSPTPIWLP